jgi:hypothetical protein
MDSSTCRAPKAKEWYACTRTEGVIGKIPTSGVLYTFSDASGRPLVTTYLFKVTHDRKDKGLLVVPAVACLRHEAPFGHAASLQCCAPRAVMHRPAGTFFLIMQSQ